MKLSETARAAEWLQQFETDDQDAAAALLDSILFVPGADVVAGVRGTVERLLQQSPDRAPSVVVPVLGTEDMLDLDGNRLLRGAAPTVFVDFDPEQRLDNLPGSEALFSQQIREMMRGVAAARIMARPLALESMRSRRVRTLIMVTDVVGSGRQAEDYVDTWYRHASVKSWHSLGLLKIVVVAYAATNEGLRRLRSHRAVDEVHVKEMVPGIGEALTRNVKVVEVCKRYAQRNKLARPLGYRDSAGLFASSFSVPNNLPAILIRRSPRWQPFFDGRSVSERLAVDIGSRRPVVNIPQVVEDTGRVRLAMRLRESHDEIRWGMYLAVMTLLPETDDELALGLGVGIEEVKQILSGLVRLGLIDHSGRLSEAGHQALQRHRRKPRRVSAGLRTGNSPYYPDLKG